MKTHAVDNQDFPVHVSARVAGQKHNRPSEILRFTPATSRDTLRDLAQSNGIGEKLLVPDEMRVSRSLKFDAGGLHVRGDVAWSNRIDLDVMLGPFIRECLRQLSQSPYSSYY